MRIKLRLEPYDPDARDADNDGIVQEGTAWERPAGAKILDDLGNEIKRGLTSPYRNTSWKLVDKDGNDLNYRPTYGNDADLNPKDAKPTLEKLGYRSIEQMGIPTVKDLALPSTKPQADTPETPNEVTPETPDVAMQDNLSSLFDELREEGDGWLAGGDQVAELVNDFENGELPEDFDDSALADEIFRLEEEAREERFRRLEFLVSPEGAEILRFWIDGRDGTTYSIRDEIEDRFLKPEDRAGQLADLVSTDRNSDAWRQEYESQLSRIQRIQYRSDGVEALLEMIDNSPIQERPLYRGMMLSPEQLDKLVQSGRINFPVGATSSSRNSALEYAGRGGNQSVLFEIEGARAFPAHLFSRVDENEFLVSGEFEIVSVGREDSPFGSVSVVKIRPTGRTYREHGRELLSGRDSDVVTPDGPDLHVQEIQAKQSADEASHIISQMPNKLSPRQERSIADVADLLFRMKNRDSRSPTTNLIYDGPFTSDEFTGSDTIALSIASIIPEEITANTGEVFRINTATIQITDTAIIIDGSIQDSNGTWVGDYVRRLRIDADGNIVVNHYSLNVYTRHQDKGIGSTFNTEMQKVYLRLGANRIEVDAVSRVDYEGDEDTPQEILKGTSFWPRQGYDWQDDFSRTRILRELQNIVPDGSSFDLQPDPSTTFVKGLSAGFSPEGPERFDIAYFDSIDEWRSFVEAVITSRNTNFDDPNRPVAGDLMRWSGADMWVARKELSATYVKVLLQPTDAEDAQPEALNRAKALNSEKRRSAAMIRAILNRDSLSDFDFGSVDKRLLKDIDDGFTVENEELFGLEILKLFDGSVMGRDGSSYVIRADEVYANIGDSSSFYVNGVIVGESGPVGRFTRTLRVTVLPDGTKQITAEHDSLTISKDHQGRGIASSFNTELEQVYLALGVERIELNGTSGGSYDDQYIGATHWPRSGFDWATEFSKDEHIRILDELVIFDDNDGTYAPSGIAYVEGLSSGKRPIGPDRRTIAYFSSVEEWENFVELLEQSRGESLSDDNRVVAGDLVRWEGADDWFAGGEYSFDYTKKLKES